MLTFQTNKLFAIHLHHVLQFMIKEKMPLRMKADVFIHTWFWFFDVWVCLWVSDPSPVCCMRHKLRLPRMRVRGILNSLCLLDQRSWKGDKAVRCSPPLSKPMQRFKEVWRFNVGFDFLMCELTFSGLLQ